VLSFIYSAAFSTLLLNGSVFHYCSLVFCSYSSFYFFIYIYILFFAIILIFNGPLGCLVRTVTKKELWLRVVKNVLFG